MGEFAIVLDCMNHFLDEVLAVLHEPIEVTREVLERLNPVEFQTLHGEEGNQPNEGANTEFTKPAVGIAEDIVEETILFVPKLIVPIAHAFHGRRDVDVVLEK